MTLGTAPMAKDYRKEVALGLACMLGIGKISPTPGLQVLRDRQEELERSHSLNSFLIPS